MNWAALVFVGLVLVLAGQPAAAQKTVLASSYAVLAVSSTYTLQLDGSIYVEERINVTLSLRASASPTDFANSIGPGWVQADRHLALRNFAASVHFISVKGEYGTPDPHVEIRDDRPGVASVRWWIATPDAPASSLDASYALIYVKQNALQTDLNGAGTNAVEEAVLGDGLEVPVGTCRAELYIPLQLHDPGAILVEPPPARLLNISYAADAPFSPDFSLVDANTTTLFASGGSPHANMTWVQLAPRTALPPKDPCAFRVQFPFFVQTFPTLGGGIPSRRRPLPFAALTFR
eukprot:tig00021126_g18454.t1